MSDHLRAARDELERIPFDRPTDEEVADWPDTPIRGGGTIRAGAWAHPAPVTIDDYRAAARPHPADELDVDEHERDRIDRELDLEDRRR